MKRADAGIDELMDEGRYLLDRGELSWTRWLVIISAWRWAKRLILRALGN